MHNVLKQKLFKIVIVLAIALFSCVMIFSQFTSLHGTDKIENVDRDYHKENQIIEEQESRKDMSNGENNSKERNYFGPNYVEVDNLDRNFPVKIHMIANKTSGNSFILESDNEFAIVDSGEDEDYTPGIPGVTGPGHGVEDKVISYMKKLGITKENFIYYIGTHAHSDHIGSGDEVLDAIPAKEVIVPEYSDKFLRRGAQLWDNQIVYDNLIAAAKRCNAKITTNFPSDPITVKLGQSLLTIYNTSNSLYRRDVLDANCMSLVVKITAPNGKTAVVGGDFDDFMKGETRVAPMIGKVDVATMNHHGYWGSNSQGWLFTLDAKILLCPNVSSYTSLNKDLFQDNREICSFNSVQKQLIKGSRIFSAGDGHDAGLDAVIVALDDKLTNNIPKNFRHKLNGVFRGKYYQLKSVPLIGGRLITKPNYYKYGIFVKDQNGKWFAKWDDTYARNEVLTINNVKYGFNDTGVLCEGWVQHNNKWYYTYASGIVKTDKWQSYKGKWYYLKSDGQMAINEKTPDGYMVDINGVYQESGQISRQWKRNSVGWWIQNPDGSYPKNEIVEMNGSDYGFDSEGYMYTGWFKLNGFWYYADSSGCIVENNWVKSGDEWYYLNNDGKMAVDQVTPDGYFVDTSGKYVDLSPKKKQWKQNYVGWWIQNPDGSYPKNEIVEMNGSDYGFDSEGYMYTGWFKLNESWYYADSSGKIMKNFWKKTGSNWYYLKYNGKMAVEEKTPDGYYIDINGICIS